MGMVTKSISITDHQDDWIKSQIATGHYGNESEVMRDLIRKEQTRNQEIETIRAALVAGEQSGVSDRSVDDIRNAVIQRKQQNGAV